MRTPYALIAIAAIYIIMSVMNGSFNPMDWYWLTQIMTALVALFILIGIAISEEYYDEY